jgi:hypothetical protein
MVNLTTELARRFPGRRFVFRLHPGEVGFRDRYASLEQVDNVEISAGGDIYQVLRRAALVVGHSSTALFEAAGMSLPVVIYDDEVARATIPDGVGTWFRTADELIALVDQPPQLAFDPGHYFARDWRACYRAFVAERMATSPSG